MKKIIVLVISFMFLVGGFGSKKIFEKKISNDEVDDLKIVEVLENKELSDEVSSEEQEIYIATNMLNHSVRAIIKIMHLRWNIENCGFRKLKQQYNLEHIFIGEFNAINYIFQMIILVSNLLEMYFKIRLKVAMKYTYVMLKKIFEKEVQMTERIGDYLMGIP